MTKFEKLTKAFKKDFGIAFPDQLLPPGGMKTLIEDSNPWLACDESGISRRYLIQDDIDGFLRSSLDRIYLTGYWGHGANSCAHYVVLKDEWRRLFFRQFWGGAYGEPKLDAAEIRGFLTRYLRFENLVRGKVRELVVINSMGSQSGYYWTLAGERVELPLNDHGFIVFPEAI